MYVFIAIIFIAELIITFAIINFIIKTNKRVLSFGLEITQTMKDSVNLVKQSRKVLQGLQNIMGLTVNYVSKKKREFIRKIFHLIIIYLMLFVFKVRYKKAAAILQYLIILKDLWTSIPV